MAVEDEDYMMRQMKEMGKILGKLLAGSPGEKEEDIFAVDEAQASEGTALVQRNLQKMLVNAEFNAAEDYLFSVKEDLTENELIHLANWFYGELDEFSEEQLEQNSFSKAEIEEGKKDLLRTISFSDGEDQTKN